MEWYTTAWLVAVIVFCVVEAVTPSLVSIWFAVGALGALLTALSGAELWLQAVVFVTVSAAALAVTRPLAKRFKQRKRNEPTNSDRNIGQTAICTERIENEEDRGAVRLMGKEWRARTLRGETVETGDPVRVEDIRGATLLVTPLETLVETVDAPAFGRGRVE